MEIGIYGLFDEANVMLTLWLFSQVSFFSIWLQTYQLCPISMKIDYSGGSAYDAILLYIGSHVSDSGSLEPLLF